MCEPTVDETENVHEMQFRIDRSAIESIDVEDQSEELRSLGLTVYNQSKFEEGILRQVDSALEKQERLRLRTQNNDKISKHKNKTENAKLEINSQTHLQHEETEQEKLIRLGHMTPFGTTLNETHNKKAVELTSFEKYLIEQEKLLQLKKKSAKGKSLKKITVTSQSVSCPESSLVAVGSKRTSTDKLSNSLKAKSSKKLSNKSSHGSDSDPDYEPIEGSIPANCNRKRKRTEIENDDWSTDDSDWLYSDEEENSGKRSTKKTNRLVDDGNLGDYNKRLLAWGKISNHFDEDEECEEFDGGYKIPRRLWDQLYNYQKVGVRWMWELHVQKCGGILGDEMGLGKTIQVIAYLAGLSYSKVINHQSKYCGLGPVLLVTPATVMHQWVKEFHKWWPPLRVAILHDSGSHTGKRGSLIKSINHSKGVLVTSYVGVVQHKDLLLSLDWHYIILDEGHKIRNPDAQATLCVKQFRTCHRFICSGSPMQNNLKELWSLFDFIYPGKLGTLPVFLQQFAVPITQGGYANASQVQVATAYKCATVLRDTIGPYLLRRMKSDVKDHLQLPSKNEQVLFCRLTDEQRNLYKNYLDSPDIKNIMDGRLQIFVGLTNLRKICNHPDLFAGGPRLYEENSEDPRNKFGAVERSGKMLVVDSLLRIWKEQQHRVLLFSQSKKMLDVLESFVQQQKYSYLRLDGMTTISSRQPLIERFNNDPTIFVFLLTTRVGGLGVNLTGADRVVIYDPDWNPSTDTQARERAWRIGQRKEVTVYRLLTSGTIEEKIYHRQIFKQYLTNRVLKDPKQRRFFKSNDLYELFTLKETDSQGTETEAIFAGTGSEVATNHLAGDENELSKRKDEEWMKKWQKEREKRELAWKKKLEKQKRKDGETKEERKRRKREEKKEKLKKKIEIDGQQIIHVIKKSTYHLPPDKDDSSKSCNQDDYVLERLFAKTGVLSALRHDSIIDAGDPDYVLVEGEAERVAKEAVQELKRSRRACWNAESGVPSWTGQNGSVRCDNTPTKQRFGSKKKTFLATDNKPSLSRLAVATDPSTSIDEPSNSSGSSAMQNEALSSSELLKRMMSRNRLLGVPAPSVPEDDNSSFRSANEEETLILNSQNIPLEFAEGVDYKSIMDDIRNFAAFRGVVPGQVSTQDILHEFDGKLPPKSAAIFRALLKELCTFHRDVHGQGVWQLKAEFK